MATFNSGMRQPSYTIGENVSDLQITVHRIHGDSDRALAALSRGMRQPSLPENASDQIWPERLDTPGYIPHHLKRSASGQFPILEVIQRLLYRLRPSGLGNLERLLAIIGLYRAICPLYTHLKDLFIWAFTVHVTIPEYDPIAKDVIAWVGSEVVANSHSQSAMLVTGGISDPREDYLKRVLGPSGGGPVMDEKDDDVFCLPPIGTRIFWVGFRPFLLSRRGGNISRKNQAGPRITINHNSQLQELVTLTTLGWSLKPIHAFTSLCREFRVKNSTGTTTVYFAGDSNDQYHGVWQSVSKAIRKLDTIDMDEYTKLNVVQDAERYYSERSRSYFADCGIPNRRGYLFHGPPGTGKSSFCAALAGHLKCDIYHINLTNGSISDSGLQNLFLGLPRKCIVVLEDIDSAGIGRENSSSKEAPKAPVLTGFNSEETLVSFPPPARRSMVTLSGLLNAIDGNASQEGRLLVMTSNTPDALDPALTRPGRIDKKVYFGNMTASSAKGIFRRLIGRSPLAHEKGFTPSEVDGWAEEFAEKVPENFFSPAQVQNFLQDCDGDPIKVLADIEAWVAQNRPISSKTRDLEKHPNSVETTI
ncbi:P-loop containing nucleoside triphosphate hydrolase protein [Stemphylium lycopersici]|nr:P-loop containing nucleoside triphosphate hydrolase protein [Stemphylium lycopersici]